MRGPFKRGTPALPRNAKDSAPRPKRIIVKSEGIWCPTSSRCGGRAEHGDVTELRASEPGIENDVAAWARKSGNKALGISREEGSTSIIVRVAKRGKEVAILPATKANLCWALQGLGIGATPSTFTRATTRGP